MAHVTYIGRNPSSDNNIVPKTYADSQFTSLAVTSDYVASQIALLTPSLVNKAYVDAGDASVVQQSTVASAANNYLPISDLGIPNGVAQTDGTGLLFGSQIPGSGLPTDRVMKMYDVTDPTVGTIFLPSSRKVTSTQIRAFKAAQIVVPDPAYPWVPIPIVVIQGSDPSSDPGDRMMGTGNYGQIAVMPPSGVSDVAYAGGVCTASFYPEYHLALPFTVQAATPLTQPPITGGLELDLYLSVYSGTSYTFTNLNFTYQLLVVPSM